MLLALNHNKPDRTPRLLYGEVIGYVPAIEKLLREKCSPKTPREYFHMDLTDVILNPTKLTRDRFLEWFPEKIEHTDKEITTFSRTYDTSKGVPVDEWGVYWRPGSMHHFAHIESPLSETDDFGRVKEFPWPDIDEPYRYDGLEKRVASLHQEGIAVAAYAGSIFEQSWYIRGMERILEDMLLRPEIAHYLFDQTAYYQKIVAVGLARAGVDLVMLGDDVACQTGLMMSIQTWREFLKHRMAKTIQAVRDANAEAKVFYHSDGNITDLIPDLIEIGVHVLNPVQPECVDPAGLKQIYGKELCFFGSVSVQNTLPFGTCEDVRREVKKRTETLGSDGGFILSPAHVLEPEVPWENIVAFFEAADERI